MGKSKKGGEQLGKAIIRARFKKGAVRDEMGFIHTTELDDGYDWGRLQSVTEQGDLDEFLATAELAGTEFTAEKLNVTVVTEPYNSAYLSPEQKAAQEKMQEENKSLLTVPRRPSWTKDTSAEELQARERESFLEWRRQLAVLQEEKNLIMTPFERNLEVWRQLWRVIERCHVIVQIVDARNPLLFRSSDLEKYVLETSRSKKNLLLVNKADMLSETQREQWRDYFVEHNIRFVFWSASREQARLEAEAEEKKLEEMATAMQSRLALRSASDNDLKEENVQKPKQMSQSSIDGSKRLDAASSVDVTNGNTDTGRKEAEDSENDENEESNEDEEDEDDDEYEDVEIIDEEPDEDEALTKSTKAVANKSLTPAFTHTRNSNSTAKHSSHSSLSATASSSTTTDSSSADSSAQEASATAAAAAAAARAANKALRERSLSKVSTTHIFTREELFALLRSMCPPQSKLQNFIDPSMRRGNIGLVGYPNVGKSSSINALCGLKKVAVSATPGKTKHFQTILVDEDLCLCDCPGLVFPSFLSTKAEMVCNGMLPIDQLREFVGPVTLVCQRIPRRILEATYGINIIKPAEGEDESRAPTCHELLHAYGFMRGFMTGHGSPDEPRSSRYILKDYVGGKLLYCVPPPGIDPIEFNQYTVEDVQNNDLIGSAAPKTSISLTPVGGPRHNPRYLNQVDEDFFHRLKDVNVITKGVHGGVGMKYASGNPYTSSVVVADAPTRQYDEMSSKKHNNRNKREKTRRLMK